MVMKVFSIASSISYPVCTSPVVFLGLLGCEWVSLVSIGVAHSRANKIGHLRELVPDRDCRISGRVLLFISCTAL